MRQDNIDSGQIENIFIFIMICMHFFLWISQTIPVLSVPRFVATLTFHRYEESNGTTLNVFNFDLSSISGGFFSLNTIWNSFLHFLKKILPSGDFHCKVIIFSKSSAGGSPCLLTYIFRGLVMFINLYFQRSGNVYWYWIEFIWLTY